MRIFLLRYLHFNILPLFAFFFCWTRTHIQTCTLQTTLSCTLHHTPPTQTNSNHPRTAEVFVPRKTSASERNLHGKEFQVYSSKSNSDKPPQIHPISLSICLCYPRVLCEALWTPSICSVFSLFVFMFMLLAVLTKLFLPALGSHFLFMALSSIMSSLWHSVCVGEHMNPTMQPLSMPI